MRYDTSKNVAIQKLLNQYSYKKLDHLAQNSLVHKQIADAFRIRHNFKDEEYKKWPQLYENLIVNTVQIREYKVVENKVGEYKVDVQVIEVKEALMEQELFKVDWIIYESIDSDN